jgi:hypothetical protein
LFRPVTQNVFGSAAICKQLRSSWHGDPPKEAKSGTTPYPKGGGTRGGNAQQHMTQAAAREQTDCDTRAQKRIYMNSQAHQHPQQEPQPREQRLQEYITQHHAGSEDSPAGRRKDRTRNSANGCIKEVHNNLHQTVHQTTRSHTATSRSGGIGYKSPTDNVHVVRSEHTAAQSAYSWKGSRTSQEEGQADMVDASGVKRVNVQCKAHQ